MNSAPERRNFHKKFSQHIVVLKAENGFHYKRYCLLQQKYFPFAKIERKMLYK